MANYLTTVESYYFIKKKEENLTTSYYLCWLRVLSNGDIRLIQFAGPYLDIGELEKEIINFVSYDHNNKTMYPNGSTYVLDARESPRVLELLLKYKCQ